MDKSPLVFELAAELGFDLAGIAPLRPPRAAERFQRWLAEGHHGSMGWLEKNQGRICDPRLVLPEGKSLVIVGLAHSRPAVELEGGGRVARYAAGADYHNKMGRLLEKLVRRLRAEGLIAGRDRRIVDAGPLLERSHAAEAGLGFESKAANLLHPDFGPWFFLGEVLVDAELPPTSAPPPGSCGTCSACIDACPTGAIVAPGTVHAPDCISYQTIENRGRVPWSLRSEVSRWVFGCDICSEVCPFGDGAPDLSQRFGGLREPLEQGGLVRLLELGERFDSELAGSPLRRPGRAGLARNAALALSRVPGEESELALLKALSFDTSALVREAAAWSLGRGHAESQRARDALERAAADEPDPGLRADLLKAREAAE